MTRKIRITRNATGTSAMEDAIRKAYEAGFAAGKAEGLGAVSALQIPTHNRSVGSVGVVMNTEYDMRTMEHLLAIELHLPGVDPCGLRIRVPDSLRWGRGATLHPEQVGEVLDRIAHLIRESPINMYMQGSTLSQVAEGIVRQVLRLVPDPHAFLGETTTGAIETFARLIHNRPARGYAGGPSCA